MSQGRLPRYMAIAESLASEITAGKYSTTRFLPGERELAESLHVCRTTVRAALKLLEESHLIRAEHGRGYRILGSNSSPNAKDVLQAAAVIMPFMNASTMQLIARGCGRVLNANGYDLVMLDTTGDTLSAMRKRERYILETLLRRPLQGVLWWPSFPDEVGDLTQRLADAQVRIVMVDRFAKDAPFDYVGVDNFGGAYQAVEHLITEGHTCIAHITQEALANTVLERKAGYLEALKDYGLDNGEGLIYVWKQGAPDRARLIHQLLSGRSRPTALFCVNDYIAVEVLLMLQDFGAHVPQDIAIVGFDDARECQLVRPALSTVAQPLMRLGETAAMKLLERCRGEYDGPPRRVILPTELVVRESSVR